ncbi:MAG: RNA polymerase sigma factor [Sandaracinaceae bacterium]
MDDSELFAAWQGGDAQAGNELFERHFDGLYRFFRGKVDDGAEDLVQKTLLACVRGRAYRGDGTFRAYLYAVARNALYDALRAKRRHERLDFGEVSLEDLGTSPTGWLARREEQQLLHMALRRIPVDLQIALELFYFEDLSAAEVAQVLDVPEGTVRSRVRRGLAQLRAAVRRLRVAQALIDSTLSRLSRLTEKS